MLQKIPMSKNRIRMKEELSALQHTNLSDNLVVEEVSPSYIEDCDEDIRRPDQFEDPSDSENISDEIAEDSDVASDLKDGDCQNEPNEIPNQQVLTDIRRSYNHDMHLLKRSFSESLDNEEDSSKCSCATDLISATRRTKVKVTGPETEYPFDKSESDCMDARREGIIQGGPVKNHENGSMVV